MIMIMSAPAPDRLMHKLQELASIFMLEEGWSNRAKGTRDNATAMLPLTRLYLSMPVVESPLGRDGRSVEV